MKINIYLNDNKLISGDVETFDVADTESKLNNPRLLAIPFGNLVLNKNTISAMGPEVTTPTAEITLHNGVVIQSDVENFNAAEIAERMNQQLNMMSIGQMIVNKNIVRMVAPVTSAE